MKKYLKEVEMVRCTLRMGRKREGLHTSFKLIKKLLLGIVFLWYVAGEEKKFSFTCR